MGLFEALLGRTAVYRAIQAPFAERKLAPFLAEADLSPGRRVLDVGCGPGTNTRHFRETGYLGIDVNPRYIAHARRTYGRDFVVADVTRYEVEDAEPFDVILANSFFHHIGDDDTDRILAHLATLLAPAGRLHVLDLVLPHGPSAAYLLARLDRGEHPRPLEAWRELLSRHFEAETFLPYDLGVGPLAFWKMVYFKGAPLPAAPAPDPARKGEDA
ncbi:MAG: class I SAM-dependent methyltransferase [Gemmatimonadetes bacterium]|nr:class I SAM-dependent methyltransferase [Gemmatimonadota bacterium]